MRTIITCLFLTSLSMASSSLTANIEIFKCPTPGQITANGKNWTSVVNPGSWIGVGIRSGETPGKWKSLTLSPNANGTTQIECTYDNGNISTLTQNVCVFSSTETESCSSPNYTIDCAPLSETATLSGYCDATVVGTDAKYPCFSKFDNQLIFKSFAVKIGSSKTNCDPNKFIKINTFFTVERHPVCVSSDLGGQTFHTLYNPGRFSVGNNFYQFCPEANITFSLPKNGKCS